MSTQTKDSELIFSGGLLLIVGFALNFAGSFLGRVVMARYLGSADYGIISFGLSILGLSAIALVGVDRAVGRFVPRMETDANRLGVVVSAFQIAIPVALVLASLLYLLMPSIAVRIIGDPRAGAVLAVLALTIPLRVFVRIGIGAIQGIERSRPKVLVENISIPLSRLMFLLAVVLVGGDLLLISYSIPFAWLVAAILTVFILSRTYGVPWRQKYYPRRRELLSFSLPLAIVTTSNMLFTNIDIFFLAALRPSTDIGVYSAAYSAGRLVLMVLRAFSFLTMPVISRREADNKTNESTTIYKSVSTWIVVFSFPLLLSMTVFPGEMMRLFYGAEYGPGSTALQILAVGFAAHALAGPNEDTLVSTGANRAIMIDSILSLTVNLVLNSVLIPRYGIAGAAAATASAFVTLDVLLLRRLYRRTGITPLSSSYSSAVVFGFAVGISAYLMTQVVNVSGLIGFVGVIAAATAMYFGMIVKFGVLSNEWEQLNRILESRTGFSLQR